MTDTRRRDSFIRLALPTRSVLSSRRLTAPPDRSSPARSNRATIQPTIMTAIAAARIGR
jgi:hypothetical protein